LAPVCSPQTGAPSFTIEGLIVRTSTILLGAICLLAGAAHATGQRDLGHETLQPENGWAASGSGVTGDRPRSTRRSTQ